MKTIAASNRVAVVLVLFDMHTKYLLSALEGISDEDAHSRLNTKANHIAWLTGSIVHERFAIANELGVTEREQAAQLFENHKGIEDDITYPSLETYKEDWEKISPLLRTALLDVPDEKLDESFEMMPGVTMTYWDLFSFTIYREANIIGQIALWRRLLGYAGMKYM